MKTLLQTILQQNAQDLQLDGVKQVVLERKHKIRGKYKKKYKHIKLNGIKLKLRLSYDDKVLEEAHRDAIAKLSWDRISLFMLAVLLDRGPIVSQMLNAYPLDLSAHSAQGVSLLELAGPQTRQLLEQGSHGMIKQPNPD